MSVKLCVNCTYLGRITVDVAPGKVGRVDACLHPDFVNPVNGHPLPVQVVREHKDLCTFHGYGFTQKANEATTSLEDLPQQGKLVLVNDK